MLINKIIENQDIILYSNVVDFELLNRLSEKQIVSILSTKKLQIERITYNYNHKILASKLSSERKIPKGDALHAILARDHKAILITRDKHFELLNDICTIKKPEDLI